MQAQKAEGTRDLIGREMRAWQKMQQVAAEAFGPYGFAPMETPAIEQLDVFVHGIGQSTDVVRKEMFRVFSGANFARVLEEGTDAHLKPKQRLALRPEGTAGVVRSVVENNLVPQGGTPFKAWYAEAMFRGERPQKGRLRQFHQVGIEWLGAPDPAADAECIIMLMDFYRRLGFDLSKLRLLINSMGDPACRPAYREQVRSFILDHADEMCDECRERAELNPLRAFDCKNEHCREVMKAAPLMRESLCDDCREHYEQVKRYLDAAGIEYVEDPTLVRGLDYYTRTVFEVEAPGAGVGSIGGGGRYDGLVELEGGKPTPGVGFAVGFERVLLALEAQGVELGDEPAGCVYVANAGDELRGEVFGICRELRAAGLVTEANYQGRSLKSQFKQADKLGAALMVVVGGDELAAGQVRLRNMATHEERLVARAEVAAEVEAELAGC
ncbi:histidine--tRNA ligase [Collinsella intestinalis]|uniref:histidine--tRNA ligase n=1 Tax=Collinsella intestinalis TaxID=147207 RepID=UPI00195E18A8|nr:histidine--tRNA ligase [Collinsella intestinalis]MBM6682624.1 histidine--tRNA ligase [Collinsella intestinalis]